MNEPDENGKKENTGYVSSLNFI